MPIISILKIIFDFLKNLTDKFLTVSFQNVYESIGFLINSTAFALDVVATVPAIIYVSFATKIEIIHFLEIIIIINTKRCLILQISISGFGTPLNLIIILFSAGILLVTLILTLTPNILSQRSA